MSSIKEAKSKMDATLEAVRREFASVRTGKATPALLDTVRVEAYGSKMPLNQVATVSTPEAALLVVDGESRSRIAGPETGFDLPLAYNATAGAYLVRSFENDSITAPGRSTLVLAGADGERKTIAEGEVTLVGWTRP